MNAAEPRTSSSGISQSQPGAFAFWNRKADRSQPADVFNIFNRVQFAPPGEVYNPSTINTPLNIFGVVTGQQNLPRLVQLAMRLSF
jgi:hypothetical protein